MLISSDSVQLLVVLVVVVELHVDDVSPGGSETDGVNDHDSSAVVGASMHIVNVLEPSVVVVQIVWPSVVLGEIVEYLHDVDDVDALPDVVLSTLKDPEFVPSMLVGPDDVAWLEVVPILPVDPATVEKLPLGDGADDEEEPEGAAIEVDTVVHGYIEVTPWLEGPFETDDRGVEGAVDIPVPGREDVVTNLDKIVLDSSPLVAFVQAGELSNCEELDPVVPGKIDVVNAAETEVPDEGPLEPTD